MGTGDWEGLRLSGAHEPRRVFSLSVANTGGPNAAGRQTPNSDVCSTRLQDHWQLEMRPPVVVIHFETDSWV